MIKWIQNSFGMAGVAIVCAGELSAVMQLEDFPFAPAAEEAGSTAVPMGDERIAGWATAVESVVFGSDVDARWRDTEVVPGPAEGSGAGVLALGRGGEITLRFGRPVLDGPGPDLAVFENGFSDDFLELAWVEVSTDGIHFVRFPNYSATASPVGAFGTMDTRALYGLAGKYRRGFGTPFDLGELAEAYAAVVAGEVEYAAEFEEQLLTNFPYLDLNDIRYVRLVDVVGDGTAASAGRNPDGGAYPIYDPYPTVGSAGFDVDAVAVLYAGVRDFGDYAEGRGLSGERWADADGDGWADGLEYLLGGDPVVAGQPEGFGIEVVGAGEVRLRMPWDAASRDGWVIEESLDGREWKAVETGWSGVEASGEAGKWILEYRLGALPEAAARLWRVVSGPQASDLD